MLSILDMQSTFLNYCLGFWPLNDVRTQINLMLDEFHFVFTHHVWMVKVKLLKWNK